MTDYFSLTDDLPDVGITVLEASAGTGKTYAIAALAARFVADGVPIQDLMIVTFSRSAASELRSRVHDRLASCLEAVKRFSQSNILPTDEVDRLLCTADLPTVISRLSTALGEIDLATIATIHEYSSRMLDELGMLVDHDSSSSFREDLRELIDQVSADIYLQGFAEEITWDDALKIGTAACKFNNFDLIPRNAIEYDFGADVRAEFERRKRNLHIHSYSDMVTRLADALADPKTGKRAALTLSKRFPVVMVDEFQDTDPQQWSILKKAFATTSTVVLIGDPKQAIYGFRGGDVEAYLAAKTATGNTKSMRVNYRSDPGVVNGVLSLFHDANLGSPSSPILVPFVEANRKTNRLLLNGIPVDTPVVIRRVPGEKLPVANSRTAIYQDLIWLVGQLCSRYQLDSDLEPRNVSLSDIAVLVRTKSRGNEILKALSGAGIPAVFSSTQDVFSSTAASHWLTLLAALVDSTAASLGRAALTCFFGASGLDLAKDNNLTADIFASLRQHSALLKTLGPMAVYESLLEKNDLYSRLLASVGGDRLFTDLGHIAELADQSWRRNNFTAPQLLAWFGDQVSSADEQDSRERTRRLETDYAAVTISTIHQAKGLEYPIVLLPEATDLYIREKEKILTGHWGNERVLDVQPSGERRKAYLAEQAAEELRIFYVAATRAASYLVSWWAETQKNTAASPLYRLLTESTGKLNVPPSVDIQEAVSGPNTWRPELEETEPLHVRSFTRTIDHTFKRTSYSGLTKDLHSQVLPADVDEPLEDTAPASAQSSASSKLAGLVGGVDFGTLVHAILENVNPGAKNLSKEMLAETTRQLSKLPIATIDKNLLADGLCQVVTTPLGILTNHASLADLGAKNRLTELGFELPMGAQGHWSTLADIAALFDDPKLQDPNKVLAGYGSELAATSAGRASLHGFLTGSIDAVLRVGEKYVVIDYKTNRIPLRTGEELTADKYSFSNMDTMMRQSHYPLQALIYQVCLHRYLSSRLPDYQPQRHLGGAGYLFVRGMLGEQTPMTGSMPCGVFTWQPNPEMVVAASNLISAGDKR